VQNTVIVIFVYFLIL